MPASRLAWSSVWTAFAVAPGFAQTTFTVDDDGPADFASVQVAIDTVLPGDRLLISSGAYGNVVLDKPLALIGNDTGGGLPRFGWLQVLDVESFDALRLDVDQLIVRDVPGRSRVEEVSTKFGATFESVQELFAARSTFDHSATSQIFGGAPGARVASTFDAPDSRAQFVDCVLRGGKGLPFDLDSGSGGPGLEAVRAEVLLCGCTLVGGPGSIGLFGPGTAGEGILCSSAPAEARGRSTDVVAGATQTSGANPLQGPATVTFSSQIVLSGVSTIGPLSADTSVVSPRPWMRWQPSGVTLDLELYGPAGEVGIWLLSLGEAYDTSFTPAFGLPLTIDLGQVFQTGSLNLAGTDTKAAVSFAAPTNPAFTGLAITAQAVSVDTVTGAVTMTNGDDILLAP